MKIMIRRLVLGCAVMIAALFSSSCATGPNAQYGTAFGGLGGAALGGIIGNQSGRPLEGAAIGAAAGALVGNQIGAGNDQYYAAQRGYAYAPARHVVQQQPVYVQRTYVRGGYCPPSYPRYYAPRTTIRLGYNSGGCYPRYRSYNNCYRPRYRGCY